MIGAYGLACNVYGRSLSATPGGFLENLAPRLTSYQHTATATFGFESATLSFIAYDLEEATLWAERLLCPVTVYSPDAAVVWDGFIAGVALSVGGRTRTLSLDTLANRVRVRYTLRGLGTPQVTSSASDTDSIALYGTHDEVLGLGTTDSTGATALRDTYLSARAFPRAVAQTQIGMGSMEGGGEVAITLTCAGWYASLGWVVLERTDTSTEAATTQVGALIGTASPGIGATNTFLSTSTLDIATSGVTTARTIAPDTTYRAAIEQRLSLGTTGGERFAWGVYEGRVLRVAQWAGAAPNTPTYRTRFADASVTTYGGASVDLWGVRPDAMVEDGDLLVPGPSSSAADLAARFYLERVTFSADQSGLTLALEPEASSGLDARIARLS